MIKPVHDLNEEVDAVLQFVHRSDAQERAGQSHCTGALWIAAGHQLPTELK
jgi:hypothetical protein